MAEIDVKEHAVRFACWTDLRIVCYTAVFSVVTQCSSPGALRDDTKNGCVAD